MRVRVDADPCQGHGGRVSEAPEVFELEDDGPVAILLGSPPAELRAKVANALRYRPTGAISLEE